MIPDTIISGKVTTKEEFNDNKKSKKKFSTEFKHEAACLIIDQGYSYPEACRSLDLTPTALRNWVKQLQEERGGVTPKSKAMTPHFIGVRVIDFLCLG